MAGGYKLIDKNYVDPEFGVATPGKIAMWLFLMTDAMSFSGFLLGYAVLRTTQEWPNPADVLGYGLATVATIILLTSSLTIGLSIDACRKKNRQAMLKWLLASILLGISFLCIQVYEYSHLVAHGLSLTNFIHGNNLFGSTFYMITGFHGLHVLTGVIYMICQYRIAYDGHYDNGDYHRLELCGLFWHFVDLVWILVFTFIYLL